ncbi:MAG: hypothetical protein ACREXS_10915 [Gammaproteobacteria bacterium]
MKKPSQRANDSYREALATVEDTTHLHQVFDHVAQPLTYHDRRVRALRIGDPNDIALLWAVSRGEFAAAWPHPKDLQKPPLSSHFQRPSAHRRPVRHPPN